MTQERKYIILEKRDGVARIVLNRPERRNALGHELLAELAQCLEEVRSDDSIGAVITTGIGDVAYSAGRDTRDLMYLYEHREATDALPMPNVYEMIRTFPKVTIAAVNGYCLGAAIAFITCHDIAIASEENAHFGLPEVFRGFLPRSPVGALFRAVPTKWAFDLLLSGANWDARTAQMAGLVSRVAPHSQLQEKAFELARIIAGWDRTTLQYCKKAAHAVMDQLTYQQSMEVSAYLYEEHDKVNPRSHRGLKDFVEGKGIKANF